MRGMYGGMDIGALKYGFVSVECLARFVQSNVHIDKHGPLCALCTRPYIPRVSHPASPKLPLTTCT